MFLVGLLQWWYGRGWLSQAVVFKTNLARTAAFFSIGELAATLFSPFRQISAGQTNGPIGVQLRAFVDQLISRVIGAIVRTFTILIGVVVITVRGGVEALVLVLWLMLPIAPIAGFIVYATGWVPGWM